ncbi:MAG TPA: NAD-dependent epimerase/dehydratase family protein [Acidimicrobiia bacterium]|jgi:UDP-glucose 4-epimerase|nr:NAD-dependent epimerase/dehydratase family protein [Acidimicrobiia bacterium]
MGMRVLVTGLSTYWGGKLAQILEARPDVDVVVGLDTNDPRVPLERTEFVRSDSSYSILARIVKATQIDTVLHTHLIVDSTLASSRTVHEVNVIGTMSLLAAAGAAGSPVRKVVLKSSGLVYGSNFQDPYQFREDDKRTRAPRTNVERSLVEVEGILRDFADDSPHVDVTLLRFANVLGDDIETPYTTALKLPLVPEILGFDPRIQFVHEDDVVGGLMYATTHSVPGVFNVGGDGSIPWSEVCAIVGKRRIPFPPILTNWAVEPLKMLRIVDMPPESLMLLRYGRHMDNDRYKRAGFHYRYTTAGTVDAFARGLRLAGTIGNKHPGYRWEREVESFFRHSPAVVREQP